MRLPRHGWVPLGLAAVLVASCAGTTGRSGPALTRIEAGVHSTLHAREFMVIEDAADFALWYRALHAHRLPSPTAPRIDFHRHLVLVASMGQRPTGGYAIGFSESGVSVQADTALVTIIERHPAQGKVQTSALTNPYAIATLPRDRYAKVAFVGADGTVHAVRECETSKTQSSLRPVAPLNRPK